MDKSLIGIHINSNAVSMVKADGTSVFERIPSNLMNEEGIISPELLSDYLAKIKRAYGVSGSNCAIVLPERATFFRSIETPAADDDEIKLNLPFEFKDFIGSNVDGFNYDYAVEEIIEDEDGEPESYRIFAAAGSKQTIDEYAQLLKDAGFKLQLALPNEMCIINIVRQLDSPNKEICLIGVGYYHTRVYIFKGTELRANKIIDIGNHDIDKVIAETKNIDESAAAALRVNNQDNILGSIYLKEMYEKIGVEVMKAINFYKYEFNDTVLDTAYFYGLGSNNEYLSRIICKNIEFDKGDAEEILPDGFEDARTLVAIGLIS